MEFLWLPVMLGLAYVVLCGYTVLMQDQILYYPDTRKPSTAQLNSVALKQWPSEKSFFRGYLNFETRPAHSGLVIVFHGNAGAAWQRSYYNEFLEPLGFRVLLAEYPGYGGRTGKLGENNFVKDAGETIRLAHAQFGGPVYLCGESLGAGVATALAADPPVAIEGLILITPWDSLADVAARHYWYLPVRLLARDRYDNIGNLSNFTGPVAVVLAENDEIVPVVHGQRLYESIQGSKKVWRLSGAGHNTWTAFLSSEHWAQIAEFIKHRSTEKGLAGEVGSQ